MPAQKPTRRQFGVSAVATALLATAGIAYGSRDARAVDVGVQDLHIEKQTASAPDAPTEILLVIDGDWQIDSNVVPDKVIVIPRAQVVESAMGMHEYQKLEISSIDAKQASGEFQTKLNLRALQALRDAFPSTEGQTVSKDITVELLVGARKDGTQIGSAQAVKTFTLELQHAPNSADVGFAAVGNVELKD